RGRRLDRAGAGDRAGRQDDTRDGETDGATRQLDPKAGRFRGSALRARVHGSSPSVVDLGARSVRPCCERRASLPSSDRAVVRAARSWIWRDEPLGERHGGTGQVGTAPWSSPSRTATAAASVRVATPSLPRMFETWTPAVLSLMNSVSAMRRFVYPSATRARTSRSRPVSPNGSAGSATAASAVSAAAVVSPIL